VQRIPRYTLLWQCGWPSSNLESVSPLSSDPQAYAPFTSTTSKAARGRGDRQTNSYGGDRRPNQTRNNHVLSGTNCRRVSGTSSISPHFSHAKSSQPGLISNSRRFIDCIDVEDVPYETTPSLATATASGVSPSPSCCTLFLFDDRLVIVKRPNPLVSGRTLAGLDDIDRLIRTNGIINLRKSGMTCKGVLDISEVVGTDSSGALMHFFLERPPVEHGERWSTPLRSYQVVFPPQLVNFDPGATNEVKTQFLEKLWNAQAMLRTKGGRSVALQSEELEVDSRGIRTTYATTYFNVYQRTPYLVEPRKVGSGVFWHGNSC